jgi:hypothetical protein
MGVARSILPTESVTIGCNSGEQIAEIFRNRRSIKHDSRVNKFRRELHRSGERGDPRRAQPIPKALRTLLKADVI